MSIEHVRTKLESYGYTVTGISETSGIINGSVQYMDDYGIGFGSFTVANNQVIILTGDAKRIVVNL